jgi:hypothetical protein
MGHTPSKGTGVSLASVFVFELVSEFVSEFVSELVSTEDMGIASTELYSEAIVGINRAAARPLSGRQVSL